MELIGLDVSLLKWKTETGLMYFLLTAFILQKCWCKRTIIMNAFVFCKKFVLGFSCEVLYTIIQMFDTEKRYTVDVYGRTTDPLRLLHACFISY